MEGVFLPPGEGELVQVGPSSASIKATSPGGWEDYLRDMAVAMRSGGPPDPKAMAEIAAKHDFVPVDQP